MITFDENTFLYDELLSLLSERAKSQGKRKVDPVLKNELDLHAQTISKNFKILHRQGLSEILQDLISTAIQESKITIIPSGSILLEDLMRISNFNQKTALSLLSKKGLVYGKIDGRGKPPADTSVKYNPRQTIVIPPPSLLEQTKKRKTLYHIFTRVKPFDMKFDTQSFSCFDEILLLGSAEKVSLIGSW